MCQELISQSLETISRLLPRRLETSRLVPRPSANGQTPLDLAEQGGYREAKKLLLQHLKEHGLNSPGEA